MICNLLKYKTNLSGSVCEESIDYHKNKMDIDNGLNMEKICHKFHNMFCFALEKPAHQNVLLTL